MKEFDGCYCDSIIEKDGKYIVNVTGDTVWSAFSDILYDLKENNIDPAKCDIFYQGTFGPEPDEWLDSVPPVCDAVNSITVIDADMLVQEEIDTFNYAINKYNLTNIKFKCSDEG